VYTFITSIIYHFHIYIIILLICNETYTIVSIIYIYFLIAATLSATSNPSSYYLVTAVIRDSVNCSGYRRLIYEDAQRFRAYYHPSLRHETIWYPPESNDLSISVVFDARSDARDFLGQLATYSVSNRFRFGLQIADEVVPIACSDVLHSILVSHYIAAESSSPLNTAILSDSVVSYHNDPLKDMRSLEALNKVLYPKEHIYGCHIAQASRNRIYERDDDNIIYGSSIFHAYFDGDSKRPPLHSSIDWGTPPELAIEFVSASDTPYVYNGNPFYSIKVNIIFRSVDIAMAMEHRWREGTSKTEDELVYSSFFYANNVANVKKYLSIKMNEAKYRWRHCNCEVVDFTELDVAIGSETI
jgi:hypothetical protein